MSAAKPAEPTPSTPPPLKLDWVGGASSYLVPGLGQISQGRVSKGIVFLVCLYGLFFYGMSLGSWKNVYVPDNHPLEGNRATRLAYDLYNRAQFVGQFFIGVAAWPAVHQYAAYDSIQNDGRRLPPVHARPTVEEINRLQRDGSKEWDLGWVYTVIAGVLNVLVIYDALAGPAFRGGTADKPADRPTP